MNALRSKYRAINFINWYITTPDRERKEISAIVPVCVDKTQNPLRSAGAITGRDQPGR
jgi:hypothetical protein